MSETRPLIAKTLSRAFSGRTVVDQVSLALEPGQVTSLIGPSGSGKTQFITNNLFKNINLFERLSAKYKKRPAVSILPLPDFDDTVET
ncbi:MAG: ATP-binding cassette domain-containing protein, partial [Pseudomonadota bacterium]|nr:ATP-binding cassette domain-containing protein [Pseudomonadota bacterium]